MNIPQFSVTFTKEEFDRAVYIRFIHVLDLYTDYCRENAIILDVVSKANTITGNGFKEVLTQSAVYYGCLYELINIMKHFSYADILNTHSIDYNPMGHVDMLKLCIEIVDALKPYVGVDENL